MYCILCLSLTIISGCSVKAKNEKIIGLQKNRILKLEKQLHLKNQVIQNLKADGWVNKKVEVNQSLALSKIKRLARKGQFALALKESSRLKKAHPTSLELISLRVKIFNRMGLTEQAKREFGTLKKLQSQRMRKVMKR